MKKVLVVEDDPSIRWLLKHLLRDRHEIIIKNNGLEAFSWLSVRNIPDLIISDIKMPFMDGFEFLENLSTSSLYKNIPVIMLTGFIEAETVKRCLELGAYSCLAKPFNPNELFDQIASVFVSKMFL